MKCKQLGLRVLSTAAIMSIVSSIAAPAFADVYYLGDLDSSKDGYTINVDADGKITVNGKIDEDKNVIIRGGTAADYAPAGTDDTDSSDAPTGQTIGESAPITQEAAEEQQPVVTDEPEEEADAPEEETEETPEEPEQKEETPAEDKPEGKTDEEQPKAEEKQEEPEQPDEESEEEAPAAEKGQEQPKTEEKQEPQLTTMEAKSAAAPVAQNDDSDDDTSAKTSTPVDKVISVINNWLNGNFTFTIEDVNIKSTKNAALSVSGSGKTTVELDGNNVLDSSGTSGHAGLEVGEGSNVTITDSDGTVSADGTVDDRAALTATGGNGGAGIGGAADQTKIGNITINGTASITAIGSSGVEGSAGIGTGGRSYYGGDNRTVNDITIGGNALVNATGVGSASAGIGGSYKGEVGNITITDNADVTAKGSTIGIGSGQASGQDSRKETTITINDHAHVNATGSTGIGSGSQAYGNVTIKLQDHAKVTATGGSGAAIGTGRYANNNATIIIGTEGKSSSDEDVSVDAKVVAQSYNDAYECGAAIGGGSRPEYNHSINITIQGGAIIENATTTIGAVGIGSGGIGYATNQQSLSGTIVVRDSAKIKNASGQFGMGFLTIPRWTTTSDLKILGNATLENLLGSDGGIRADSITIDDNATISNLEANPYHWSSLIHANKQLTIGDGVDITLTQPTQQRDNTFIRAGNDADGNPIYLTKNDVQNIIGEDGTGKITYRIKNTTTGEYTLQYIAHGKNGCNWVLDESQSKASTCTEKGKAVYVCKLEDGAVNPSCTHGDNGTNTKTIELELADHRWNDGVVTTPATCESAGVRTYTCTVCNETRTETIPATGHQHTEVVGAKAPTCTDDGYTGDTVCDDCGETIATGMMIEKLNHDWDEGKVTTEPTCTEAGVRTYTCKNDPTHTYTEEIPAVGHAYGEWTVTTPATCTENGVETRVCANDASHVETREIAATGHQHTHIEGAKDATETEDGYTGDTVCDDCGAVVSKGESTPAKGVPAEENTEKVSTPELWVLAPDRANQLFTVSQSGTVRTYTSPYNSGTLTGTMEILQYLQEQGVETIVFTTNQRTSRFAVADLLALVNEGDVFYLQHMDANDPVLLVIANDHSDLLNG